jgi:putative molybdopterin biosynthesis protein
MADIPGIENNLAALRHSRGYSAARLAELAGVTRQTIYSIEAGSFVPNTAVALRLARILDVTVDDLFALPPEPEAPAARTEHVTLLPESGVVQPGQPVQLCRVGKHLIASSPSPLRWYFPAADAVLATQNRARIFDGSSDFRDRILVAGCDPGISVLARHMRTTGVQLVFAHRNSSMALELLRKGRVHIAGTHLRDESSGESNLPHIGRLFPKRAVAVISFAVWEEGIVVARGNPKGIRNVEDFARADVTIVNREPGAGARALLDSRLKALGIAPGKVRGYQQTASGHLPAAWQVQTGAVDCCIATHAAARIFGLGFVPLVRERYDLAVRTRDLELPGVQTLFDTLGRAGFRRELEDLGGYDTRDAGQRLV